MSIEKVRALKAEYEAALATIGRENLAEPFKKFLTDFPMVDAVKWTQYTPYFADGDVCEFSVNDLDAIIDGEPVDLGKTVDWVEDGFEEVKDPFYEGVVYRKTKYTKKEVTPISPAGAVALDALQGNVDEDIYRAVFGDHVEVTYTLANGFEVEEYQHD